MDCVNLSEIASVVSQLTLTPHPSRQRILVMESSAAERYGGVDKVYVLSKHLEGFTDVSRNVGLMYQIPSTLGRARGLPLMRLSVVLLNRLRLSQDHQ